MFEKLKAFFEKKKLFKEKYIEMLKEVAEEGRLIAIEQVVESTPPNDDGKPRGANTITGSLKASWEESSDKEITDKGNRMSFMLRNNMDYASYVDKGHSMDQHFVLGLYINPYTGLLTYEPDREKAIEEGLGITVGTKTSWVEGLQMTEKAKETFENYTRKEIERRTKEIWESLT